MFKKARLKLTAWYVLIIMLVSIGFSAFIYRSVSVEFQRRLNSIENRFQPQIGPRMRMHSPVHEFFLEDLEQARSRVFITLLYANGFIFLVSSTAGYFLAGKTLQPIQKTLEEQKRFVADASHELKTPLTALSAMLEVSLRDKNATKKSLNRDIRDSLAEVHKLKDLTNNLLDLARTDENRTQLYEEEFDISSLTKEIIKVMKPLAQEKGIRLEHDLEMIKLNADREKIKKLIEIILDNAIKYSEDGVVKIVAFKKKKDIQISIKDTGMGIDAEDLPHIFDRFYRADLSRTKDKAEGFGLGLSIAKKIVDSHDGKLDVESKKNQGTEFIITLPIN